MTTNDPRPLTRRELSEFLPSQRAVRAFEKLFDLIPPELNSLESEIIEVLISSESTAAKVNSIEFILDRLKHLTDLNALKPSAADRNLELDTVLMGSHPRRASVPRLMNWNYEDDTLNIHHTGGVIQQVGEEVYARATNSTGVTIPNGSVVGLSGVGLEIELYIADGSSPSIYMIGVATEDILDTGRGRMTTYGRVKGIDTSSFSVGDVLYASPTTAGSLTNVKPSAPDLSIPLAVVVVSDATDGIIFVKPVIEQQMFYGSFSRLSDSTIAVANTAQTIVFDTSDTANGVSLGTPASRIVINNSGLYTITSQYQVTSTSTSVKEVWYWFRVNGVDVPNSAMRDSVRSGLVTILPTRSLTHSFSAGDYVELMWASDDTTVRLDYQAATAFAPACPACTVTINQTQH